MINVIARSEIKPGCMEKYMQVLKANVPTVLAEEGCIRYEPCVDVNAGIGPEVKGDYVTILESWESVDHLRAHLATKHMAAFREAVASRRGESTINVVTPA